MESLIQSQAVEPLRMKGLLRLPVVFHRALCEAFRHDCLNLAQSTAYSGLVSLFPVLIVAAAVIGSLPDTTPVRTQLSLIFDGILPPDASPLIESYFVASPHSPRTAQGLIIAVLTGVWTMKQLYQYVYFPICFLILLLGALGKLPRVGKSTKGEGIERRYFYGSVWAVTISQTVLLILWKTLPKTATTDVVKLVIYTGMLLVMGAAAYNGALPRTRPIMPGELMVD